MLDIMLSAKYWRAMDVPRLARVLGRLGGLSRARRLPAAERQRIAALGGLARRRSLGAARRIAENFQYLAGPGTGLAAERRRPLTERIIALDRVLANMDTSQIIPRTVEGVKADPPPIFSARRRRSRGNASAHAPSERRERGHTNGARLA